jgi:hypothetical protein
MSDDSPLAVDLEFVPVPDVGYLVFATREDGTVNTFTMTMAEFQRLQEKCTS